MEPNKKEHFKKMYEYKIYCIKRCRLNLFCPNTFSLRVFNLVNKLTIVYKYEF